MTKMMLSLITMTSVASWGFAASGLAGFPPDIGKTMGAVQEIVVAGFEPGVGVAVVVTGNPGKEIESVYSLQQDGDRWVCKNTAGQVGHNNIDIADLLNDPKRGQCANLRKAVLQRAALRGADMSGADLIGADMRSANLIGANLIWADIIGTYLRGADMTGAYLSGADLTGSNLSLTNLAGADLSGANLRGTSLIDADMRGADLSGTDLIGAYLQNATLSGADLSGADMTGAYLSDADLGGANLIGAILTGTNLIKAKDLRKAKYSDATRLPFGDDEAKKRGMEKVE